MDGSQIHHTDDRLHEPANAGWIKHGQVESSKRDGVTTLEYKVNELRSANEFLKLAGAFFA